MAKRGLYIGMLVLLLGSLLSSLYGQGQPCDPCVTVLESQLSCPTDESGQLTWSLVIRNDADFAITYAFFVQTPGNITVSPNPYIFDPPLEPGEVRDIVLTISGSYLGYSELCFDIVFYNASLNRCCRLQHCVPLPQCCFVVRREQIVCDPHSGDFLYTFTIFNQFPAIVQYVVVVSQTPGVTVTPAVTVLNPPIGFLGSATITVRIQGAVPGQTVRLAIGLLDFLGTFCCSVEREITMPPCCFEISDPRVECTDEGVIYEFTLTNWFWFSDEEHRRAGGICYLVVFPLTEGVSVSPNPIQLTPPLQYGESRRIRLQVSAPGCGGQVCLQLLLLDCLFRMCCSNSTCFEVGAAPVSRLWTTTEDFAEGEQDNVDISDDEIKLPREQTFEYPWVWVTNYRPGTISKIDARTYKEVARYYGPPDAGLGFGRAVSRTTVDRFGNVWVESRGANAVIQILDERNWTLEYDFNGNGLLDTSRDLNGDGCIDPNTEMLPFGQDELVVRYYRLGQYGSYPRALAIDLNGYLWVGLDGNDRLLQIDPNLPVSVYGPHVGGGTPPVLENLQAPVSGDTSVYGFVTAPSGYMYGAAVFASRIYEWCPGDPDVPGDAQITQVVDTTQDGRVARPYGIAVGPDCTIWAADWSGAGRLIRWYPSQGQAGMAVSVASTGGQHRGVNVDLDGNVWTSYTGSSTLIRWDPGTLIPTTYTDTCSTTHSGIGIAFGGQIVNPSYRRSTVTFFTYDQNTDTITQTGCVDCPEMSAYNYNDFTGSLLRYALNEGTWRTVYDGGCNDRIWGRLDWNAFIPEGTSITVRVRAGNTLPIQTEWTTVGNGEEFCLRGRYLQIEVRLSRTPRVVRDCSYEQCGQQEGEFITPILYDIRASSLCECTRQFGTVRGKVFCDTERDGVLGPNDQPLAGWAIVIEDQNGNQLTRFTDANGEYRFENIPDGEYRLVQMTPPGWLPIRPEGGATQIEVRDSSVRIDFANALLGDVNGDQCVDDSDLLAILLAFGSVGENLPEDVNMDGIVDDTDLIYALFNFGVGC